MVHKENITIIDDNLLPDMILDVTAQQDIIIGTRLHSLILATCTETPIMAISYHHKVNDFMKLAELEQHAFPIGDIHKQDTLFLDSFNEMKENWPETLENTKKLSQQLYDASMAGTKQFVDAIKRK